MPKKEIVDNLERKIIKQYGDSIIYRNDLEYRFLGVNARISSETIIATLAYTCTSKLTKLNRERLKKAIGKYNDNGWFQYNNFKT